jgi:hypothetical protein
MKFRFVVLNQGYEEDFSLTPVFYSFPHLKLKRIYQRERHVTFQRQTQRLLVKESNQLGESSILNIILKFVKQKYTFLIFGLYTKRKLKLHF